MAMGSTTIETDSRHGPEVHADRRPETKTFLATSEFWVAVIGVAAVMFAAYVLEDITKATSWKYLTWIGIAYILSRGIAKAASQRQYDRYTDDAASARP